MIPAQAVEAAARVLLGYTGACVCHEGYTGRNLIDPDCRYHDVPPEVAKEILEAAAPHMLAGVISNRLELEALWLGSVVLSEGVSYQRYGSDEWYGEGCPYGSREIKLPAIVLHNPNPYRPTP